ncbi:MAG: AAA family ATPase [Prevotella sp.]
MIVKKIHIEKFRAFRNQEFKVGSQITAIAGQNGTQKSTLLGMITQVFTLSEGKTPLYGEIPLCGGSYKSGFKDKFRLSPKYDKPKEHEWTLSFDDDSEFTVESIKRTGSDIVRFWKKGVRGKGDGYIQYPTIFLSLKRVLPIAESGEIKNTNKLTQEEIREFKKLHDKIMITESNINEVLMLEGQDKQTLGISTDTYDWNSNSIGQDNLGKIILALFSFKRLKEKYPNDYNGGILAIDELDATMFPASQKQLLSVLRKYSSKYNIQIFFTTHSMSLLENVDEMRSECLAVAKTQNDIRIIYLKRVDEMVEINDEASFRNINLNLQVIQEPKSKPHKIPVYTEDKENATFAKYLLHGKTSDLNFIDVSLPCTTLLELSAKKVPAFTAPQALIILDGDVRSQHNTRNKLNKVKNVLVLPSDKSPEQFLASFLHDLSDKDELWSKIGNGYTKQVCFRDYPYENIISDRDYAKKWFIKNSPSWGRGCSIVLKTLFEKYSEEKSAFRSDFDRIMKLFKV